MIALDLIIERITSDPTVLRRFMQSPPCAHSCAFLREYREQMSGALLVGRVSCSGCGGGMKHDGGVARPNEAG